MKANFLLCGLACALSVASVGSAEDVTRNPAAAGSKVEVGIARRDGITVSGGEAYVTRNGVTQKLVKDLKLPSGVTIQPNGAILFASGAHASLQADQLLTLDGRVLDIPNDPNVNPAPPGHSDRAADRRNVSDRDDHAERHPRQSFRKPWSAGQWWVSWNVHRERRSSFRRDHYSSRCHYHGQGHDYPH
jgi:hypothetical protein